VGGMIAQMKSEFSLPRLHSYATKATSKKITYLFSKAKKEEDGK